MEKRLSILAAALLVSVSLAVTLTSCGSDDDDPKPEPHKPVIGEFYQGGVVFYIDETGEHGLVCTVTELGTAEWGCSGTAITGADGTAIGTGAQNTLDILAGCATDGTAADICAGLTLNGYDDWFLPSKDELVEMYINKGTINTTALSNGGTAFIEDNYWSSTEFALNEEGAYAQDFTDDDRTIGAMVRTVQRYVRAIREF